jgi:hypothetical protein
LLDWHRSQEVLACSWAITLTAVHRWLGCAKRKGQGVSQGGFVTKRLRENSDHEVAKHEDREGLCADLERGRASEGALAKHK